MQANLESILSKKGKLHLSTWQQPPKVGRCALRLPEQSKKMYVNDEQLSDEIIVSTDV